jgi:putative sterol carrier protein
MTADPTAEFFERLAARGHEPLLRRANGTLRFELKDRARSQRWLVSVKKGDVAVSRTGGDADMVVRADKALFDRFASGAANPVAAALRGEFGAEGDWKLLVLFQRLFPGPRARRRRAGGDTGRKR